MSNTWESIFNIEDIKEKKPDMLDYEYGKMYKESIRIYYSEIYGHTDTSTKDDEWYYYGFEGKSGECVIESPSLCVVENSMSDSELELCLNWTKDSHDWGYYLMRWGYWPKCDYPDVDISSIGGRKAGETCREDLNKIRDEVVHGVLEVFPDSVEKIILFGSYARGEETDESDIDICVVFYDESFKNRKLYKNMLSWIGDVECDYDACIQIVKTTKESYDNKDIYLYTNVERDGVVWYDKGA